MTSWQGLGVAHAAPPQGFISPIYCLIYECCYGPTLLPSLRPTVPSFCSLPQQQRSNNTVSTKTCFCTKKIQTFLMIFIDKELQEEREWGGDTHTHTPSHTLSAVSQTHPHTHTPTHTQTQTHTPSQTHSHTHTHPHTHTDTHTLPHTQRPTLLAHFVSHPSKIGILEELVKEEAIFIVTATRG